MPTRQYTITYTIDDSGFQAAMGRIQSGLRATDAQVDALGAKLKDLFSGIGRPAAAFERHLLDEMRLAGQLKTNIDSLSAALEGMSAATAGVNVQLPRMATNTGGVSSALGGLASRAAGITLVLQAMRSLSTAMKEARDYAHETAQENIKLRDSLRELAAMQGKPAPDVAVVRGVVQRALTSGMTMAQATEFETMWQSAIPAAREGGKWKLGPAQEETLKTQAAIFAARNAIAPETIGKMIPLIGKGEEITSPEQMMGKIAAMQMMAAEGVGHVEPIYRVAQSLRGTMVRPGGGGAGVRTAEELMAVISSATLDADPRRTQQDIRQTYRDIQNPKAMKNLGMTSDMDFVARIGKVHEFLDKSRAAGQDDLAALKLAGFGNQNAAQKIVQFSNNLDILERRTAAVGRGRPVDEATMQKMGANVIAANAAFLSSDVGQARTAEREVEAARIERGRQQTPFEIARQRAEARLIGGGEIDTPLSRWIDRLADVGGAVPALAPVPAARERRIMGEAMRAVVAAGGATRWETPEQEAAFRRLRETDLVAPGGMRYLADPEALGRDIGLVAPVIQRQGGQPYGSPAAAAGAPGAGAAPQVVPVPRPPQAAIPAPPAAAGGKAAPGAHAKLDAGELPAAAATLHEAAQALLSFTRVRGGRNGAATTGPLPDMSGETPPFRA
jgi:hypothetical protein